MIQGYSKGLACVSSVSNGGGEEGKNLQLSRWHVKVLLTQQRPPRGVLVSFRSEGIPENNSNDTPSPPCGAGGLHNHKSIKINQLKKNWNH